MKDAMSVIGPSRHAALPQNSGRFQSTADMAMIARRNRPGANDPLRSSVVLRFDRLFALQNSLFDRRAPRARSGMVRPTLATKPIDQPIDLAA
jgi:hypothetical protein